MTSYAEQRRREIAKKAALSGGISGALLGAGSAALRSSSLGELVKPALAVGGAAGASSGLATYLGSHIMGDPENDTSGTAFTDRAARGGALGGGIIGAGLGGLAGSRKLDFFNRHMLPQMMEEGGKLVEKKPNVLLQGLEAATRVGGGRGALIGAALGGLGLGALSGVHGADEGMQLDLINNKMREAQKRRRKEELLYGD